MVVTGCGSDDVLDSAIRAFAEPGDRVAHPEPSFAMVPIFARMNALEPVAVPLTPSFDLDAEAMLATEARVIYLCSPNNPTGNALSRAAIERVVERAPGVVILDEAYAEFAGANCLDLLARSERLLVVRTMSKAFGLAGLRVGYAAGAPTLAAAVEKSRGPYKVHALAERAALAALTDDASLRWVRDRVAEVRENRARLVTELAAMGYETVPSDANFVLISMDGAARVGAALRERGVAARPFGIGLRVTVGPWGMMEEFLRTLRACA
jgi:histidinol-phosphate aminotransferase